MFNLDEDIMRQLRATFKIEAAEHIQAMNRILLTLEENPEAENRVELLQEIFREAHSLKGASGAADLTDVEATAHKLENVFGGAKAGRIKLTHDQCDVLYQAIDAITVIIEAAFQDQPHGLDLPALLARLDAVDQGQVPPKPAPATPAAVPAPVAEKPLAVPATEPPVVLPSNAPVPPSNGHRPPDPGAQAVGAPAPVVAEPPPASPSGPPVMASVGSPATAGAALATPETKKASKTDERKKSGSHAPAVEETIRVDTRKIDSLMAQAGELLVAGLKIDQRLNEVKTINHSLEEWNREWLKAKAAGGNVLHDDERQELHLFLHLVDTNQERLKSLTGQVNELWRGFARDAMQLSRVTNGLSEEVMKVRMLPVATVFDALPRLVRDVARETGKEVELKTEGAETELDRQILEQVKDPLMHLLRNAIDHGIEKPEERLRTGKPSQGTVTLQAFQKGNNIVLQMADDGAGINRKKVKQAALKANLISAEQAETLSDDETLRLIFASGLSTSSMITDISGRGVGMDVVRKNIEALQGQIDIESTLGQGTRFILTLPLTLATTQELLVRVGEQTLGIPIAAVERIHRIRSQEISSVQGHNAILIDGEPISLVRLAQVLELPAREPAAHPEERFPVVILGSARRRIAFVVDAVVGQQETVVKSLGKQLARVRNVAGATILGTGQVIMTLNPADLMKSARGVQGQALARPPVNAPQAKPAHKATILVVDDSMSTRTLEKSILETAGYKVVTATDGLEALNLLSTSGSCDLVVSDVMMPHMTGLELTAALKGHANLKKIPVILVTSLDSREDKERGIEVGADAYLIKSNFDQSNLLQTITQLI
jgi:two-component system, chemotaxis family, sensor kinase CheA